MKDIIHTWRGTLVFKTKRIEKKQPIDIGFEFSSQNDPKKPMDGFKVDWYFDFDA